MKQPLRNALVTGLCLAFSTGPFRAQTEPQKAAKPVAKPPVAAEAGMRARLLHETIHGALQVMHRDFFDEEKRHDIPSSSLEDVFVELKKQWDVEVAWMAVNAKAMSIDHQPKDAFQRAAAEAITGGAERHEEVAGERFRYAGAIRLGNQCLKCHVPNRTTLEERRAAVLISMQVAAEK
jgi:hypothetical protein